MVVVFISDTDSVSSYEEVIRLAGQPLVKAERILPEYSQACIDREVDFPTGLQLSNGIGLAMPHGHADLVKEDSISILRLKEPVEFGLMEDKSKKVSVSLVFHLALSSGQEHLQVLRKVIRLFQNENFITQCLTDDVDAVASLVEKELSN
ncbi:PTS sugar transporter subunit IIA [Streptococcus suis]|uniref:PTS sugar transporter subunit IIA n=1 Tax=Streptococcus suis TaxID=1307 RepID=UPI0023D87CA4|nr:PTS sugar transporter subunit IIA [Streptococcus suis]